MGKNMIFKTTSILIFWCILMPSCKKDSVQPDKPQQVMRLDAHPNDADRAIPYSYPNWMANIGLRISFNKHIKTN